MITIGLISDTHDLVRPEVFDALKGVDLILHAGDVGSPDVLIELATIAPVRAVWGNTDAPGRTDLVAVIDEMFEQVRVVVTHGHMISDVNPPRLVSAFMHADVIIYGHTHQQLIVRAARRMVINPGAAGPKRFKLQPCVGKLFIDKRKSDAQLIPLFPEETVEPVIELDDE